MELSLFSFVSLFVCLFGQQRKNNNKVSASYTRTNKRSPFFLHCKIVKFSKKDVLNLKTKSISRSYHEKTNASHQHSAFKPRWAPIVLRLVIT